MMISDSLKGLTCRWGQIIWKKKVIVDQICVFQKCLDYITVIIFFIIELYDLSPFIF